MTRILEKLIIRLTRLSMPYGDDAEAFIVTSAADMPTGVKGYCIQILEDVTGFSVTDSSLKSGSGAYPTDLVAGTVIYGTFTSLTVSGGTAKVYMP